MKLLRITNPAFLNESELREHLEIKGGTIVVQFDKASAYSDAVLAQIDQCCRRFDSNFEVRFYGHYTTGDRFDCRVLQKIPSVRSLLIDCLTHADNTDELDDLKNLESFSFGVFEANFPDLLKLKSLQNLRKLTLGATRKNNIDLALLASFGELTYLTICGHTRNIDVLSGHSTIQQLRLIGIGKKIELQFVSQMARLETLYLLLGGRESLNEIVHNALRRLEIVRVRGFNHLRVEAFPGLKSLQIEDQPQLTRLDVSSASESLEQLRLVNCKQLCELVGLERLAHLNNLNIGQTAVPANELVSSLPKSLRRVSLWGFGLKRDREVEALLRASGYAESAYTGA
jgi:hypothetical protein